MLIATAGHIDHGKTSLIRALTGVETDRLPEERARGISIDLGFAYWRPDDGETIGFVDVPGHERFVRNMLAGLSGIGFALLVVAADDGVMPQTVEHLRLLELLGIARGVVALTKTDRVENARVEAVRGEVAALLDGTLLSAAPILPVSAITGAGIDALRAALIAARDATAADEPGTTRGFRLAIDRAFTVTGAGSVVTGTAVSGRVAAGDTLVVAPLGREVRVRGLQSGGLTVAEAAAGQRCAINLGGIEVGELSRGDWLVDPAVHAPTRRIEALVTVERSRSAPLRHDSRVHLHHGAADLGARVLIPRQRALQPGESGPVTLVLDAPTSAVVAEGFVLRDPSGRELIGGGRVLDPLATDRRRSLAVRQGVAAALALTDPAAALAALAAVPGHEVDAGWIARAFNLTPQAVTGLLEQAGISLVGKGGAIAIARTRLDSLGAALIAAVKAHHAAHPDTGGMTRREARLALPEPISGELFAALVKELVEAGRLSANGALLHLPGHQAAFSPAETQLWKGALAALEDRGPVAIVVAELARELRTSEAAVRTMLYRRRVAGEVWQVTETRFMLREHVAALVALAARLGREYGGFKAAQFRDASGIGRNFVIQLLEFFDRIGVTRRAGELRHMRGDWEAVVGAAT